MTKLKRTKILAGFLAFMMIVSMLPTTIFAAEIENYSVQLTDGAEVLDLEDVEITMTNKADESKTATVETKDGVAKFENFVEEEATYIISVSDVIGYETIDDIEVVVAVGDESTDVVMTEIAKVKVSGTVTDERGNPYSGAKVKVSGYVAVETTTNINGHYTFETYAGKENTISITAKDKDQKYGVISSAATYNTDKADANYQFTVKTFDINTEASENGTITASESGVLYGESRTIYIKADEGYRIKTVSVDGKDEAEAKDGTEYSVVLKEITRDHLIQVEFYKATYTVSFDVSENGKVKYNTDKEAPGGIVTNVTAEEKGSVDFVAEANTEAGYHVEKVTIDDKVELADGQNTDASYFGTVSSDDINVTVKVTVVFAVNEYQVTVGTVENGKIIISDSEENQSEKTLTVKHGDLLTVTVEPNDGYDLDKLIVGDTEIDEPDETDNGYETKVEITSDTSVEAEFVKKPDGNKASYTVTYPEVHHTVGEVTYVPEGETVTFKPTGDYERVRVKYWNKDGRDKYQKGNEVQIKLGAEFSEKIVAVAATKRNVGGWDEDVTENITYDAVSPIIPKVVNEGEWFGTETTYSFTVKDTQSGVKEVKYASTNNIKEATSLIPDENGTYNFTVSEEYIGNYYVWATDYCGNTAKEEVAVKIDLTAPTVTHFEFSQEKDSPTEKIFNILTFGLFSKDKIQVTVTATDEGAGVGTITLYIGDEQYGKEKEVDENGKATFVVELKNKNECLTGNISAVATDKVGNKMKIAEIPTTNNSNIQESPVVMLENIPPTAEIKVQNPGTGENSLWYAKDVDVEFDVSAKDEHSGIREVVFEINDEKVCNAILVGEDRKDIQTSIETYSVNTNTERVYANEDGSYTVSATVTDNAGNSVNTNTEGVYANEDGSYTVSATVTDNAGNVSETAEYTIYKDITAPSIAGFDFGKNEYVENVIETGYGYYFKQNTPVTITAKDNGPSSGVKQIAVYLKDVEEEKLYIIDSESTLREIATEEEAVNYLVNEEDQIQITIPANFKGQIYAKATDNVMNVGEFVNPNGVIVESQEKHNNAKYEHIMFEKVETNYKTNDGTDDGTELYADDVYVAITVADTYSGIRSIEWSVEAPYDTDNNQSGMVALNNNKSVVEGTETDWRQVETEGNLVTKMQKTIKVVNNSNNICLKVMMTDRAGNTTTKEIEFSIDKSDPNIAIVYDEKEVHDSTNTDFFSTDRTATITITERNFRASDVEFAITNTDKVIPNVDLTDDKTWTETVDENNPDNTTYVAKIPYTADGDYTFDISYKDNAENSADPVAQHKFTIDKTVPTVAVSYDNMSAMNGNYYKAARTATITIKEHNFDASRVNVIGVATDNGAASRFPVTSAWRDNGNDTHTATIAYTADSKYTFDIEFHDMANNSIADYTPEEFYVDKTAPNLSITGVADQSANNGDVAPVITFTDTNFNKDAVTITLSGVNNGRDLKYAGSYNNIANGQTYTYANFEKVQSVDDIYTLTARLTDKAGNQTEKTITFSANRFGSVYSLENVEDIIGKYLQNEQDIVFTETNVDSLDRKGIKIKLTKNGMPTDLVEGKDYTIEASGGKGQWSVYKYTVKKALFADDGRYSISIYSKDAAGNVNENIDETKTAEISFGIDKTNPVIVPINLKSDVQYAVDMKTVSVEIKDNLVLEDVKIYLNGKEIEYTVEGETYTFDIPKDSSKQDVKIVAIDAAGNEEPVEITDFLVNANIFVRWYNNTALFVGSIIGVVVIALGITGFIVFGKKKKEE